MHHKCAGSYELLRCYLISEWSVWFFKQTNLCSVNLMTRLSVKTALIVAQMAGQNRFVLVCWWLFLLPLWFLLCCGEWLTIALKIDQCFYLHIVKVVLVLEFPIEFDLEELANRWLQW